MTVRDEVCGMRIKREEAAGSVELEGRTYHFCSARCKQKFEEHPDWYVETSATLDRMTSDVLLIDD